MKRIVLCFDGTWCTPADEAIPEDQRVETNVRRFFRSVAPIGPGGIEQDAWYNEGVGTHKLNKFSGAAFGAGLDYHILQGYRHLAETYADGDEVYILGFSRGAYTARSLVGMLRNCGLVRPSVASFQIGIAYGIYRTRDDGPDSKTARAFRSMFAREIPVRFVGVWDTVGALGIPLEAAGRLNAALYEFHDTQLSVIVEYAYQAIALDEHRGDYDITFWDPKEKPGQTLEQRWFAGSHADVGGGLPDRRLSDLSLQWIQDRASAAGLALSPVSIDEGSYKGTVTDSFALFLGGLYARAHQRHLRPVLRSRFGNESVAATVDQRRRDSQLGYRPANPGLPVLNR
jgi:uncharacterized protein (DUF2235 family)